MTCPLCRREFAIPVDGLPGLQKNFYVENLVYLRKLSAGQEMHEKTLDVTFTSSMTLLPGSRGQRSVTRTVTQGQFAQTSSVDRNENKVL